jgi:hypothetical protein
MNRLQQLAGLITESQLNELSPELLQRAADKAKEQGRTVQAGKFWGAAQTQLYKAAQKDKTAKLEPVKPFNGKPVNFYFNIKNEGNGIEVPHTIRDIYEDTNNVWIVVFSQNSIRNIPESRIMGFKMDDGFYTMGNDGWGGENYQTAGIDQAGAQLLVKLAKTVKPDAGLNPNNMVNGQPTPIAGKSFTPTKLKAESLDIEEVVDEALETVREVAPAAPKQTADVASLAKMISSNTTLMNKLKTVNSGQEVTETIAFILNNINPKATGVNKSKLKSIIDQRFQ